MKELITGVMNDMGVFKIVVTGQKDNMVRVSIHGREQWVGEGDSFTVLNDVWEVVKVNPVSSGKAYTLEPNKVVAVLSLA